MVTTGSSSPCAGRDKAQRRKHRGRRQLRRQCLRPGCENRLGTVAVRTRNDVFSSPVLSGGVVYIGSDDGHVYALE
ncbi:MAG: hypothetical protein CL700_02875 [Chloroflexi bacterium]|nr:hypothetical protein [Chloroflexota bacterium]